MIESLVSSGCRVWVKARALGLPKRQRCFVG